MLEQIQTVNKDDLTDYIGFVDDERLWRQINAALKKTFGLGSRRMIKRKAFDEYIERQYSI